MRLLFDAHCVEHEAKGWVARQDSERRDVVPETAESRAGSVDARVAAAARAVRRAYRPQSDDAPDHEAFVTGATWTLGDGSKLGVAAAGAWGLPPRLTGPRGLPLVLAAVDDACAASDPRGNTDRGGSVRKEHKAPRRSVPVAS